MLYLYMYLTRNHQDFRGKFLFPFLVLPEKGEKLRKKEKLPLTCCGRLEHLHPLGSSRGSSAQARGVM